MSIKALRAVMALSAGLAVAAGGAAAQAHTTKGEKAHSPAQHAAMVRHDNFEKLGAAFKRVNDELKKPKPSTQVVQQNSAAMRALTAELPTWFPKGSGQEARPKSEAKANIWTDTAGFSAAASKSQAEVAKLHQLAVSGDIDAVRAQVRATGGSCKGCHDKYRQEKKS